MNATETTTMKTPNDAPRPRYTRATWKDAGLLREALTEDFADWHEAGFISFTRSQSLHRRARLLARMIKRPTHEVQAQLSADGRLLAEMRDEPGSLS